MKLPTELLVAIGVVSVSFSPIVTKIEADQTFFPVRIHQNEIPFNLVVHISCCYIRTDGRTDGGPRGDANASKNRTLLYSLWLRC
jgi:hypothetical protein